MNNIFLKLLISVWIKLIMSESHLNKMWRLIFFLIKGHTSPINCMYVTFGDNV